MAAAIRRRWPATDELPASAAPSAKEIGELRERTAGYDLVVVGTDSAHLRPAQAELGRALLAAGPPVVSVALRTPWDLGAYEQAATYVCTYGVLEPTMEALAAALFGEEPFRGRLPVPIAGLYPRGHGLFISGSGA